MNTLEVLKKLAESAERFVNKAPKQTRLEAERQALLDAITHAQLVLSVSSKTTPDQQGKESSTEEDRIEAGTVLRSLPGSKRMSKKEKHIIQQRSGRRNSKTVAP